MNGRRLGFPLLRHLTSLSWNNPYLALQFQLQVELLLLMMMTKSRGGTSEETGRFSRKVENHNNHSLPASFSVLSPY